MEGSQSRPVDLTELDNRVAQLATKLEVACQDTSSQLERTIEDISRNVPRLNFDLQFMRESALALQRELNTIHSSSGTSIVAAPNDSTSRALEQLQFLDSVKKGMEAARAVLQEAENWSTLESEITSLIKEASYAKAAIRLSEAAKSMSVFQHTPEYESRRTLMINLQNQTEAALSAALVAAINVRDVIACKNFHEIFERIEREGEFRNYYFGARRIGIQDLWTTTTLSDVQMEIEPSKGGYSLKFSELLARFFSDLLTLVNEERSSIPSIFSTAADPTMILSLFIQSVFETLAPSLSQRLSGMAAHYGSIALPELIKAFKMTEDFAMKVEKIMEKIVLAKTGGLGPTSPGREEPLKGHSRQKSKRLSISRRMPSHRASISIASPFASDMADYSWEHVLFEPFIDFQCEYGALEKRFMDDALVVIGHEHAKTAERDAEMQARNLRERAMDVYGAAEEGLGRCLAFTHGYGAIGVIQAVDHLFVQFYNHARSSLLLQPKSLTRGLSDQDTAISNKFEEELLSQDELASFQLALNLLNSARAFKDRLDGLDSRFMAEIVQVSQVLRASNSSPRGHYITGTPKGEAELLAQSSLNSMNLVNLLETIDVPTPNPPFSAALGGSFGSAQASANSGSAIRSDPTTPSVRQQPILKGSFKALTEFSRAIQTFLQQLILSPLLSPLSTYHTLPLWSSTEPQGQRQRSYEFSIPTFSLSATSAMQRVCDGLRALPRMFEDYAGDDEALGFSLETLPFIERDLGLKDYLEWTTHGQSSSADRNPRNSPRSKRLSMSSPSFHRLTLPGSTTSATTNMKPPALSADLISSAWISSMTLKLLSHLTSNVLPQIRALSTSGSAQLAYDLEDLCNIARALNADWEDLERWRECCEMSDEEGRRRWLAVQGVSAFAQGSSVAQEVDSDAIIKLVARMRGWTG